jgi:phage-related minor tail protein
MRKLQPGQLLTSTQFAKAANVLKTSGTAAASYTALAYALQNKTIRMAKGGIVTGPTNALIGEAGPEAVIPLSGANSVGMGSTYNINVNAGIGTNGAQVGRDIVEAIRKYERSSGQVFVRV